MALRKEADRSQAAALTTVGTSLGTNQPGGGKRRRGMPEELATERAKKKKDDRRPAAFQG